MLCWKKNKPTGSLQHHWVFSSLIFARNLDFCEPLLQLELLRVLMTLSVCVSCSGEGGQREPEDSAGRGDDGELPPHLLHAVAPQDLLPGVGAARGQAQVHRAPTVLRHHLTGPAAGETQCKDGERDRGREVEGGRWREGDGGREME